MSVVVDSLFMAAVRSEAMCLLLLIHWLLSVLR